MITRIPQPQFVGPAPAESVAQAADTGARWGQLIASGVQEGLRNAAAQKQEETRQQSAKDQLALQLKYKTIMDYMNTDGPVPTLVNHADEVKDLFEQLYPGKGDHIYEGVAKSVLNNVSGAQGYGLGMFNIGSQASMPIGAPSAGASPQPQASAMPTSAPQSYQRAMPGGPNRGAMPESAMTVTPTTQPVAAAASPVGLPQIQAAMQNPTPGLGAPSALHDQMAMPSAPVTELPSKLADFSKDKIAEMATDKSYVDQVRAELVKEGIPEAATLDAQTMLSRYASRVAKFNQTLGQPSNTTSAIDASNMASSITNAVKGVSGAGAAAVAAAQPGFQKLIDAQANKAAADLTPKEKTAMNQVIKQVVSVTKNSEGYKAFIAAGGTEAAAQQAAQSLQDWINSDPQAMDFLQARKGMSAKEYDQYVTTVKNDTAAQIAQDKNDLAKLRLDNQDMMTAYKGMQIALTAANQIEATRVRERLGTLKADDIPFATAYNAATKSYEDWVAERNRNKSTQNEDDKTRLNAWLKQVSDPSTVEHQLVTNAARLGSPYFGMSADDPNLTTYTAASFLINTPFGGLIQTGGQQQVQVPTLTPQGKAQTPTPAQKQSTPTTTPGASSTLQNLGLGQ